MANTFTPHLKISPKLITISKVDSTSEIPDLVALLNSAWHRLEELTLGDMELMAGIDSRMFVLQSIKEEIRKREATKQAAILNAIPASIALLDVDGFIISVNEGWREFGRLNKLDDHKYGIGTNYLDLCDMANGKNASEALEVSEGIRKVLNGSRPNFTIEYPCHSLIQQNWFLMTVTPLTNHYASGAVVMHINITQRKLAEVRFHDLALAMDGTSDAIYIIDRNSMKFLHVNDAACSMHNMLRNELILMHPWQVNLTNRNDLEKLYDILINGNLPALPVEIMRTKIDGTQIWIEQRQKAEFSDERWKIITVERDITIKRAVGLNLHHMAHYDALTGLPNRKLFYEALSKAIQSSRSANRIISVLFIDIDYFKHVNDTLGHAVGDELLLQFSNRLLQCVRIRDTVGRLGGDEFAIILVMDDESNNSSVVANKIEEILRTPFDIKGHQIMVTASIGITTHPNDALDTEALIKCADIAMYCAKQAGRNTHRFYNRN